MVGRCELAGDASVEATFDELYFEGICGMVYAGSDVDWEPDEARKHSEQGVA